VSNARRMPAVKPVGEPDAGNPHVRFDERGGETDCLCSTASLLDSTGPPLFSAQYIELLRAHDGCAIQLGELDCNLLRGDVDSRGNVAVIRRMALRTTSHLFRFD
jgi:hypothetical protein